MMTPVDISRDILYHMLASYGYKAFRLDCWICIVCQLSLVVPSRSLFRIYIQCDVYATSAPFASGQWDCVVFVFKDKMYRRRCLELFCARPTRR